MWALVSLWVCSRALTVRAIPVLANGRGSTSSLPDMKAWESGGHAETATSSGRREVVTS